MEDILNFLVTVRDDREPWKVKHLLSDIVLLIFFARLSGAEHWNEIEEFGIAYEKSLRTVLKLENGIPSHYPTACSCDFRFTNSRRAHTAMDFSSRRLSFICSNLITTVKTLSSH